MNLDSLGHSYEVPFVIVAITRQTKHSDQFSLVPLAINDVMSYSQSSRGYRLIQTFISSLHYNLVEVIEKLVRDVYHSNCRRKHSRQGTTIRIVIFSFTFYS